MPSPFPGMDPYLEAADLWPDAHHDVITHVRAALTPLLRPSYFAKVESRTFVPNAEDAALHVIEPDVQVIERVAVGRTNNGPRQAGGVAVAEPVDVTDLFVDEVTESYIAVMDARTRALVTVIEVVSPSNKARGSAGRRSIVRKYRECVAGGVNWLEIDLLRGGERVTAPRVLEGYAYRILRDRMTADGTRQRQAWPFDLRERVPNVGVPLKAADGEVPLDLQAALARAYEEAGYDMMVDYAADPPAPPLAADDAAWLDATLREKGLR